MRISLFITIIAIAVALVPGGTVALRADDISVAGEWDLVAGTQKGSVTWQVVFAQAGEALDVTMTGPKGNAVLSLIHI